MEKYKILIIGVVYNEDQKFLITTRSKDEKLMPGVYSYHVGEMQFSKDKKFDALERSLHLEVEAEANIKIKNPTYLSSHQYLDESGNKVVAIAFISKHDSGEIKDTTDEIESVEWKTIEDIRNLDTLPVVHEIYESAHNSLQTKNKLHYISVAGIVLNDKDEFMLIRDQITSKDKELWTFPIGDVIKLPGNTWEMLSGNLAKNLKSDYGIVIKDGAIPFTDQSFHGKDDFGGLVEFFIARIDTQSSKTLNENITWLSFNELENIQMLPSVYKIFEKAAFFIRELTTENQ